LSEYLERVERIRKDEKQKIILDENKSRVVIAGPGSGKTYLLTTKATKLLFDRIVPPPFGIACLTFSRFLENQLKDDFNKLGVLDADNLYVGTVHGFSLSNIVYPFKSLYELRLPEPFRISSDEEKTKALELALIKQNKNLPEQRPEKDNVRRDLEKYRRLFGGTGITTFEECTSNHAKNYFHDLDWNQLALDYVETLIGEEVGLSSIDFVEIELMALKLLQSKSLVRKTLAARYPWWLIDEYQDLGRPFHQMILCLLQNTEVEVIAIGDKNQCIYEELQGSKPEFMDQLADEIKNRNGNDTITLITNYRSAQELIEVSKTILKFDAKYQSNLEEPGECYLIKLSRVSLQYIVIQELLRCLRERNNLSQVNLSNIAILHPRRKKLYQLNDISTFLDAKKLPNRLDKDPNIHSDVPGELVEWIEDLAKWCVIPLGKANFIDLLPKWIDLNGSDDLEQFNIEKHLFDAIWQLRDPGLSLKLWLEKLDESLRLRGLLESYMGARPDEADEVMKLLNNIGLIPRLSKWNLQDFARVGDKIQLTTLYSSKGAQYDVVIIAGFDKISSSGEIEPTKIECRLAYVGLTRAKTKVFLLYNNSLSYLVNQLRISNQVGLIQLEYDERTKKFRDINTKAIWNC
jgi:DNA helicase-2/ATP-dependent DNA helicase PcrA